MDKMFVSASVFVLLMMFNLSYQMTTGTTDPITNDLIMTNSTTNDLIMTNSTTESTVRGSNVTLSTLSATEGSKTTLHPKLNIDRATYNRYMQLLNYWQYLGAKWIGANRFYIIVPMAVLFNVLSFVVVFRHMTSVSSCFYMGILAVFDMTYIVFKSSQAFIILRSSLTDSGCKAFMFLTSACHHIAVWLVVLMTFERVVAVKFPLKMNRFCTVQRAAIWSMILVILVGTFNIWFIYAYRYLVLPTQWGCAIYKGLEKARVVYEWLDSSFASFIPLILLFIFNIVIIHALNKASKRRAAMGGSDKTDKDKIQRQMTLTLLTVSITFCLLTAPLAILKIVRHVWDYMAEYSLNPYAEYLFLLNLFNLLAELNHCINFFLYTISGRRFRMEFLQMFCCYKKDKFETSKTFSTSLQTKNDHSIAMKELDSKNKM